MEIFFQHHNVVIVEVNSPKLFKATIYQEKNYIIEIKNFTLIFYVRNIVNNFLFVFDKRLFNFGVNIFFKNNVICCFK